MSSPERTFADFVFEQIRRNNAAIEMACEAALQGGKHGVKVTHHSNGTVTAEVCPDVPYGHIHVYPFEYFTRES